VAKRWKRLRHNPQIRQAPRWFGDRSAADFLRWLYRERRLTAAELAERLRTIDALASGKLRPSLVIDKRKL
jgi:hypothetical protein